MDAQDMSMLPGEASNRSILDQTVAPSEVQLQPRNVSGPFSAAVEPQLEEEPERSANTLFGDGQQKEISYNDETVEISYFQKA